MNMVEAENFCLVGQAAIAFICLLVLIDIVDQIITWWKWRSSNEQPEQKH